MSKQDPPITRLLAVDDEDSILLLYSRALGAESGSRKMASRKASERLATAAHTPGDSPTPSFHVVLCHQGQEAVEVVRRSMEENNPFAVAFIDIRMPPGRDGVWAAEQIRLLDPNINIVIVTGFSDADPTDISERVPPPERLLYLQKPLSVREIRHITLSLGSKWGVEKLLQEAYQDLEVRVEERTTELAAANEKLRRDIAERERIQAELHLRDAAIRSAANAVVITDRDGAILSVNPAFTQLTGYELHEVIGKSHRILKSGEHEASFYAELWDTILSGKVWRGEIINRHRDGHTYFEEQTITPVRIGDGKITHFVAVKHDVTARKKAEEVARVQQQQLIQTDKMASLGILVSGVAHEINNPNHFVKLSTSLLEKAWNDIAAVLDEHYAGQEDALVAGFPYREFRERVPALLTRILEGSERISYIVKELRDFARQRPLELSESVDVNDVIRSAVVLLSNMLGKSTRRFTVHYEESLPRIKGDFRRIEQVVINLIQNACQALPDTERGVTVTSSHGDAGVCVTVEDEGEGIPSDELGRIMDPFFTTKRDFGGTGLGLSVSSTIVKEHGGTLSFTSTLGKGTTAMLVLPESPTNDSTGGRSE